MANKKNSIPAWGSTEAEKDTQREAKKQSDTFTRTSSSGKVPASNTGSPSAFKVFNESSNATEDRLGFINRDELLTERVRTPMVLNPMGRNYSAVMANVQTEQQAWNSNPHTDEVALWYETYATNVSGIMSLDIEYTPVASDDVSNITSDIFLSKWIDIRQLDNMVKNWQPGDPCVIELGLMIVRAQMAHLRRALEVMRDVYQDSKNLYYSPVALLESMGFYMDEVTIRTQFETFWQYYNQTLVGTLNNVKWMTGNPGHFRWASLFRDVYKDNPAKTKYTQMFLFRPHRTYYLTVEEDGWHLKPLRTISEYFSMDATQKDPNAPKAQGFRTFMADTYALIRALFYDDDTQDMLATINAIAIRGKTGGNIGDVSELKFERLAFESAGEFALTFDMQMLVALQNATIFKGLMPSDITVDPKTGNISQTLQANTTYTTTYEPHISSPAALLSRAPKVINMPTFTPTQSDMFNATQWTVVAANLKSQSDYGNGGENQFVAGTFGSDVIVAADVRLVRSGVNGKYVPGDPGSFKSRPLESYIYFDLTTQETSQAKSKAIADQLMDYMNFAFAPMPYILLAGDPGANEGPRIVGPLVQAEVFFVADWHTLKEMHRQWHRNFWGYPSHIDGAAGTPTFDIQSLTERDPLS